MVDRRTAQIQQGVNVLTGLVDVRTANIQNSVNGLTDLVDQRTTQIRRDVAVVGNMVDERTRQIIQGVSSVHDLVDVRTQNIERGIGKVTDLVNVRTKKIQDGIVVLSRQIDDVTMIMDYGIAELSKEANRNTHTIVQGLDNVTAIVEQRSNEIDLGITSLKRLIEENSNNLQQGVLNATNLVDQRTVDIKDQITNLTQMALQKTDAIQVAVADVKQTILELEQAVSDQLSELGNKVSNITIELRSVIANKLREMKLEDSQTKLDLISHNAFAYYQYPNNFHRSLIRKSCDSFDPMHVLLQINNYFSTESRINEFYVDMEYSVEHVDKAMSFMERLVYSAYWATFHCMTTSETFMNATLEEQRDISKARGTSLNRKLNELTLSLGELRLSKLIQHIANANLYEKEISDFLRTNENKANEEIARRLQGKLQLRFGFIGIDFSVISLNITSDGEIDGIGSRVLISRNRRSENDPWQGTIWKSFAEGKRLIFVTWSLCDSTDISYSDTGNLEPVRVQFELELNNISRGQNADSIAADFFASHPTKLLPFQVSCIANKRKYFKYQFQAKVCPKVKRIKRIHSTSRCDSGFNCPLLLESPTGLSTFIFNAFNHSLELYFDLEKSKNLFFFHSSFSLHCKYYK